MSKLVLTCRPSQFVRHPLRRIKVVLRYIPRRRQDIAPALTRMQRYPTPGPTLIRGHIRTIIRQATPILLPPQSQYRPHGARTQGSKWTWMFQLKSRNLTSPLANNNGTCLLPHPSYSRKCRHLLSKHRTKGRSLRRSCRPPLLSLQGPIPTRGRKMTRT